MNTNDIINKLTQVFGDKFNTNDYNTLRELLNTKSNYSVFYAARTISNYLDLDYVEFSDILGLTKKELLKLYTE